MIGELVQNNNGQVSKSAIVWSYEGSGKNDDGVAQTCRKLLSQCTLSTHFTQACVASMALDCFWETAPMMFVEGKGDP